MNYNQFYVWKVEIDTIGLVQVSHCVVVQLICWLYQAYRNFRQQNLRTMKHPAANILRLHYPSRTNSVVYPSIQEYKALYPCINVTAYYSTISLCWGDALYIIIVWLLQPNLRGNAVAIINPRSWEKNGSWILNRGDW